MSELKRYVGENAAGRLFRFFEQLKEELNTDPKARKTGEAWLRTAKVAIVNKQQTEAVAAALMLAATEELDHILLQLTVRGVPDQLATAPLSMLYQATALRVLQDLPENFQQFISHEALTALGWVSLMADDDSTSVSAEKIDELKAMLHELQVALNEEGIPPAFRRIAMRSLKNLAEALQMVHVRGVGPLSDAIGVTLFDAAKAAEVLKAEREENPDSKPLQAGTEALTKTLKTAAEVVGNVEKLGKAAGYLWDTGTKIAGFLGYTST